MEKYISKAKFVHDDEDEYNRYSDEFNEWVSDNEEKITAQELIGALEKIGKKFTDESKYPVYDSNGYYQAEMMVDKVLSLISDKIDDGSKPKQFQEASLNVILKFLQYGVGTIHMSIILKIVMGYLEVEEYLKTFKGEKLTNLISTLCTPPKKRENTEAEVFYEEYSSFFQKFMDIFEASDLVKYGPLKILVDHAAHTYLDYEHLEEECVKMIVRTADNIFYLIDDSWKKYRDVEHLQIILKRITACVKKSEFPRHYEDEMAKRYMLAKIINIACMKNMAEPLNKEIFDLLEAAVQSKNKNDELLFQFIQQILRYLHYQDSANIKKKPNLFKMSAERFMICIKKAEDKVIKNTSLISDGMWFLEYAFGDNKQLVTTWVDLALPLISRPCKDSFKACETIFGKDTLIKWKEHEEKADKIFKAIASVKIPEDDEDEEKLTENFSSCVTSFIDGLKNSRILKKYSKGLLLLSIGLLEMKRDSMYSMAYDIAYKLEIDAKQHKDTIMGVLRRLHKLLEDDDLPWDSDNYSLRNATDYLLQNMFASVKDGNMFTEKDNKLMVSFCVTCLKHDGLGSVAESISVYFSASTQILTKLIEWLGVTGRMKLADKIIPLIIQKCYEDEDEDTLLSYCSTFMYSFGQHGPELLANHLGELLKLYMEKDLADLLYPITQAYPHNPAPLKGPFQQLLQKALTAGDQTATIWLGQVFHAASKHQPELFTAKNVKDILVVINDNPNEAVLLQVIQELCKRKPEKVVKNIDLLLLPPGMLSSWINDMLCTLALFDKCVTNKVLDYLFSTLENQDKANLLTALNSIRLLTAKYLDLMKPRRAQVEAIETLDPDGQNIKQMILDIIDGKTTEEMQKQILSQQDALTNIEIKVDEVDETVTEVKQEVGKQGKRLDNVTNTVVEHEQRLDQVEETVDETVLKVEEIDSKTLSHAPYWSRDISKLLNPQTEHDWRLLASRLAYSNNDIRGWAQQADPCMAMLNEWYATRKTSEATLAILTHLQEMNSMDAAIIVENAMKNAEAVVEDEEFEYASPPPIFISYQWGHQEEVKLLKKHLEMAGYECWLDIGQMGGGDKLFEKIDNGIRAAKVVISCISNKYTKSPNCNREVNLSLGLHKPLIPLLMEQCPWPPPGSMGPIFSESLFIRFFQRNGEETTDQRYWPEPKFLELLMQLNMNGVPPDEAKIERVYKNWWMPIEAEIKIDKNKTKNGGQANSSTKKSNDVQESTESPEVFISYQWGKQKNVIKLYQRLTGLGFSCWLDIKQMGGGDSLYDKIDRGIRGSKVVLSCVTQKYSLSANCRREVSLADALKKPLIPLLLEKMTWPPSGPMSMVMTQLLYIGFTEEEVQNKWSGPQFDELISKITQHIPIAIKEKPVEKEADKPVKKSVQPDAAKAAQRQELEQKKPSIDMSKSSTVKTHPSLPSKTVKKQEPETKPPVKVQQQEKSKDNVPLKTVKEPEPKLKTPVKVPQQKIAEQEGNAPSKAPANPSKQNSETPSSDASGTKSPKPQSAKNESSKVSPAPSANDSPKSKSCSIL